MTVRDWSEAHFRMVAVRMLELAALLLVVVAALEVWVGWSGPVFTYSTGGDGPPFDFRVWSVTMALFRGPIGLVVAALLLGLCLAVIHRLRPVAQTGVLQWEIAAVVGAGLVVEVVSLVAVALSVVTPLPFGEASEKAFYLANAIGLTLAGTLPLVLVALWWWRLFGAAPADEGDAGLAADRIASADSGGNTGSAGAGHAEVTTARAADPAGGARAPAAGAPVDAGPDPAGETVLDADPATVERIEPVSREEAIIPLSADGSTSNGYDDYFRRR